MSVRVAVLASKRASDLPAIVKAIESNELAASIVGLISNVNDCGALEKARGFGIKDVYLPAKKGQPREEYDKELGKAIDSLDADLILLIGFMRILSPWFVKRYRYRVMNIHPSILPAFAGGMDQDVHQAVLEHGCKMTGCSLIFIDEGEDTGPIIIQKSVAVQEIDTPETLKEKVQALEQEALIEGIKLFYEKRLKVEGRVVRILPKK